MQTDWGESKTITSKDEVKAVAGFLDGYAYRKNSRLPSVTGYLYNMRFYSGEKELAELTLGKYPEINSVKFETTAAMDMAQIEKIVGMYPPSAP